MLAPMDKGKGPASLHYPVDRRDGALPNGGAVHGASSSDAGLLSTSMDQMRGNAGAQALLRGVAQRGTGAPPSLHLRQKRPAHLPIAVSLAECELLHT